MSRSIGLLREIAVAVLFGTSATADQLTSAFAVAAVAGIVIGEAVFASSVRWLSAATTAGEDVDERFRVVLGHTLRAAGLTTVLFAVVGPLTTIGVLGTFSGAHDAALISIALAPAVGANVFVACINARLTLARRFALLNGAPILYSVGAVVPVAVLVTIGTQVPAVVIAGGWSAGNLAAAALLWRRARPRPVVGRPAASRPKLRALLIHYGLPASIAYSVAGVQSLTDRAVAARLGTGSVAALAYADRLFLIPIGFILATIGPMVFGRLATQPPVRGVAAHEVARLRQFAYSLVGVSFAFVALGPRLIETAFESGEFGASSATRVGEALDGLAIGIPATALMLVLFRAMQAVASGRAIATLAATGLLLNVGLTIGGAATLGLFGITLATSLTSFIVMHMQASHVARALGYSMRRDFLVPVTAPVAGAFIAAVVLVVTERAGIISTDARLIAVFVAIIVVAVGVRPPRPAV